MAIILSDRDLIVNSFADVSAKLTVLLLAVAESVAGLPNQC
jgi:hypothetical protein